MQYSARVAGAVGPWGFVAWTRSVATAFHANPTPKPLVAALAR